MNTLVKKVWSFCSGVLKYPSIFRCLAARSGSRVANRTAPSSAAPSPPARSLTTAERLGSLRLGGKSRLTSDPSAGHIRAVRSPSFGEILAGVRDCKKGPSPPPCCGCLNVLSAVQGRQKEGRWHRFSEDSEVD